MRSIIKKVSLTLLVTLCMVLPWTSLGQTEAEKKNCESFRGLFDARLDNGTTDNFVTSLNVPRFCSAGQAVTFVINLALSLAGVVTVVFLILGGFIYMSSAGNEEQAEKGKKILINSVIGLVVIIMSFAIVRIIGSTLSGNLGGGAASTTQTGGTGEASGSGGGSGGSGGQGSGISLGAAVGELPASVKVGETVSVSFVYSENDSAKLQAVESAIVRACATEALSTASFELYIGNALIGKKDFSRNPRSIASTVSGRVPANMNPGSYDYSTKICGVTIQGGFIEITGNEPVSARGSGGASLNDSAALAAAAKASFYKVTNSTGAHLTIAVTSQEVATMCQAGTPQAIEIYLGGELRASESTSVRQVNIGEEFQASDFTVKICGYQIQPA